MYMVYLGESTNFDAESVNTEKQQQVHTGLIIHERNWVAMNGEFLAVCKRYFIAEVDDADFRFNPEDMYEGTGPFDTWDDNKRMSFIQDVLDILIKKEIPMIAAALNHGIYEKAKTTLQNPEALTKPIAEIIMERFLLALNMFVDELQMSTMDPNQIMESTWAIDDYSLLIAQYGGTIGPHFMKNFLSNELNIPNPSIIEDITFASPDYSGMLQLANLTAYLVMRWLTEPEANENYVDYINGLQDGKVLQVIYPVQL
ncbi:MAG TPA: hypothetical protein DEZ08_08665 [Dehalococcoidia bacterium]|jgi:hypothetical protein|nr:hypothetical protein [Dehalococcoidia bacterium]